MKKVVLTILVAVGLASMPSATATIIANVDTPTELSGTFSFDGNSFDSFSPVGFAGNLPGTAASQFLNGGRSILNGGIGGGLASDSQGFPNDVALGGLFSAPGGAISSSGSYNNSPSGLWVDFALQGSESSGVADGVFSGTFSFTVRQTRAGVPEGGSTLAMLGLVVAGCAGMWKRVRRYHT